ncbi:alpha/beta fold hydrolase [Tranquillimonas alkanivorans]|uniref:Pimeloyl-ACP methyl ester carboxylesterase n=1 Tax=Tranquillimonas alkanivorans TaxID=441119 RepID=A0A1I5U8L6_9RHOB|nr:alpha/beta hydrolase [Tranquillimonas alkanivorans]SFP91582.1 Pimeloyl-ACP methyl ester carboxylesterase [Tranquillimonas alkanivorans]
MDFESREVEGIRMRWGRSGDGPPVVFLHGIPTSPDLWRRVVSRLPEARCLAWEMVGYGASIPEGEGRDLSVAKQADYLVAWLREIGIDQAILVGHDLGGGVAQIAATRYPKRCSGLLLTNSICYDSWPIPSVVAMQKMRGLLPHVPERMLRKMIAMLFYRGHDQRDTGESALHVHWRHYSQNGAGLALARQVAGLSATDTLDVAPSLPNLDLPARVVWGAADQFQKIAYGERLARDLRAPLTRIEGGKHFTPEDHPDEVAQAVRALLKEQAGRSSASR